MMRTLNTCEETLTKLRGSKKKSLSGSPHETTTRIGPFAAMRCKCTINDNDIMERVVHSFLRLILLIHPSESTL